MPTQRQERVNNLLQREISDIIRREMEDPHLAFLTITGVQVSPDLRHASVFVSVLGEDREAQQTVRTLGRARGFIRGHLMDRLEIRQIPQLHFRLDRTAAQAQYMERLLHETPLPPPTSEEPPADDSGE